MSDEKISQMPSAGVLLNSDMMPVVRPGSPNLNLQTTMSGLQAFIGPVATKTANYTILTSDTQTMFDNSGAASPVTLSLPSAAPGLRYSFVVASLQGLTVSAYGSDRIFMGGVGSGLGGSIQSSVPYSSLSLIVPNGSPGIWTCQAVTGAWSFQ